MIDRGKYNLLGVFIDAVDYDSAVERIFEAAREKRGVAVSALAVHGVMPECSIQCTVTDSIVSTLSFPMDNQCVGLLTCCTALS